MASACCSEIVTATITTTTPTNPSAATMAIIAIDVFVVVVAISLSPLYGWKQFPLEWKNGCEPFAHPAASACWCSGIVTATITTTTPSTANAATMATTAIDVFISMLKRISYFLKISATKLQNKIILSSLPNNVMAYVETSLQKPKKRNA